MAREPVQRTSAPLRPYRKMRIIPQSKGGIRYSELNARVAVRLVQLDYNRNPDAYRFTYLGVQCLADRLRADKACPYTGYWYLISLAKWLHQGGSMSGWVAWASNTTFETLRAIHKRPFRGVW